MTKHNHEEHDHDEEELHHEIDLDAHLAALRVFERQDSQEMVPVGFTATTIYLDGTMNSTLNWKKECQEAKLFIDQGYKIVFDLDLGLFERMPFPLAHQAQFQTLSLSIEHFLDTVWSNFKEHTAALIIAKSDLAFSALSSFDPSLEFRFQEWLTEHNCAKNDTSDSIFRRNLAAEYLQMLIDRLPDSIAPIILLDAQAIDSPLLFAKLTAADCWSRIVPAIRAPLFPKKTLIWKEGKDCSGYIGRQLPPHYEAIEPSIGIVLPSWTNIKNSAYAGLEEHMQTLNESKIPFKVVHEELLTTEWEGLDTLIIPSTGLSEQGKRKLQGFIATGGQVF